MQVRIGLIGDFNPDVVAHQAIPLALAAAGHVLDVEWQADWLATETLTSPHALAGYHGLWAVPATPYRSMDGALLAIRHARETGLPFLGTCGGFQHALVEYARNVLGWADAQHAEEASGEGRAVIAPLHCALVEVTDQVRLLPGSRIADAYGEDAVHEGYHCRYGLNPEFRAALINGPMRECALDEAGDVRAVELTSHPFFVGTLFQPERAALAQRRAPIVEAFMRAAMA
ncbi:CTP synthase C-terminal region-related (seleno)protein [Amantichitinum ursilacus]|uniref:CTP synthase (glutamine hydrolyzing) n=1 Tax=Amantichitinum ursilacus TaxID=857265 RepID=A0A0N1JRK2_9NEIS|nr:CTP synthase [Amantichitinum ursilacus]KPC49570.1 CTP synthase [Amantichitinum ursilacus]